MTNVHIHHVQFDTQASDGVGTGMQFGQAVQPYMEADVQLAAGAAEGATTLQVVNPAPAHDRAPGQAARRRRRSPSARARRASRSTRSSRSSTRLDGDDRARRAARGRPPEGRVDGHRVRAVALVPGRRCSTTSSGTTTWTASTTGATASSASSSSSPRARRTTTRRRARRSTPARRSTSARTTRCCPARSTGASASSRCSRSTTTRAARRAQPEPGEDDVEGVDSTINLRAEPWADRLGADPDPSLLFSSYRHGDPFTPLPKAYPTTRSSCARCRSGR